MSTPNPFDFPVVVAANGMQPQDPADIRDQINAAAVALSPGLTNNLPGLLLEDILSTDTPAVALCDQARVELVNSLTADGANEALLLKIGAITGVPYNQQSNTSVLVIFYSPNLGYVVPDGMTISDGSNVYQVQTGGVINSGGTTSLLTAIAVQPGTVVPAAGAINEILTSYPSSITLSVTNPSAGIPGGVAETWSSYRSRVMRSQRAVVTSGPSLISTLVGAVAGVQKVSVQVGTGGLRVIVKGGDVYEVAYAIFKAVGDPSRLLGHAAGGTDVTVSLVDPPNTYNIKFVAAATQTVAVTETWNTTLTSFTGGGAFAGLVQPSHVAYINALPIGQAINELELNGLFQNAVSGLLAPDLLTRLVYSVSINGTVTPPGTGTSIVSGDAESDFFTALDGSGITVTQG